MASIKKTASDRYRAQLNIRKHRTAKTFATKEEAQNWANEKEKALKNKFSFTFYNLIQKKINLIDSLKGYEYERKRNYRKMLVALQKYDLADIPLKLLQAGDIDEYLNRRAAEKVKNSTLNRNLNTISGLLTWAMEDLKMINENPARKVKRFKEPKARERRISDDEITQIINYLNYTPTINLVLKQQLLAAYFLLALETGMRLGEISNTFSEEVRNITNLEKSFIFIPANFSKNGVSRHVPLSEKAKRLVKQIKASKKTLSMESASAMFREMTTNLNIYNLTFHDTRHEACTRLSKKIIVQDLARMLGHTNLKSLMIYYNPTPEEIARHLN